MIKKSIYCLFVLFVLHLCIVLLNPSLGIATHQWQDNIVKAQNFYYADKADTVMVGTSLSARIISDSIPSVKSVAFGGCAVEDGLKIILSKKHLPKYVLVETNLILRNGNPELVSKTTTGVMPLIRGWIPSLRERYEPICLFASMMMASTGVNAQAAKSKVNTKLLEVRINHMLENDKPIPDEEVESRLKVIKGLINELEGEGTQILFFEMPVNEKLLDLKKFTQARVVMQKEFPRNTYMYMPTDTTKYLTTDGEHLSFDEQQRFSHFFSKALKQMQL